MIAQGSLRQSEPLPPVARLSHAQSVLSPRSQRSIEQIAAGLAKIAIQSTISSVYEEAVSLLGRLPAVATVGIVRPDNHGLLTAAGGDNVVRILPPLNIDESHIAECIEKLSAGARSYTLPEAA